MRVYILITLLIINSMVFTKGNKDFILKDKIEELYEYTVDILTVEEMLELDSYYLFDIRSKEEFDVSRIKGAQFLDYSSFHIDKFPDLPKDSLIILYCTLGYRSERVGEELLELGYSKVFNLYGGIIYWVNRKQPVYVDGVETNHLHGFSKSWSRYIDNPDIIIE